MYIQNNLISFTGVTKYVNIPKGELEELIVKRGYSLERVGRMYKMPYSAVVRRTRMHGIYTHRRLQSEKEVKEILSLKNKGYSDEEIIDSLKYTKTAIKEAKKREEAAKDSEENLLKTILDKLNLKKEDVQKYLK